MTPNRSKVTETSDVELPEGRQDDPTESHPPPFSRLRLDASGCIDQDLECLHCSYNLRGLLPDRRCPECGTPVGRSAHGDWLCFCDPDWVNRLASGMNWIWWGLVCVIVTLVILLAPAAILALVRQTGTAPSALIYMTVLWIGGGLGMAVVGLWRFTGPEPGKRQAEKDPPARKGARVVLGLSAGLWCFAGLFALSGLGGSKTREPLVMLAGAATGTMWVICLAYARTLARRGPDLTLARHTRWVAWGLLMVVLVVGVSMSARWVVTSRGSGGNATILDLLQALQGVAVLTGFVCAIWSLWLLERYRKLMRKAAGEARRTWARQPGPGDRQPAAQE